MSHQDLLAFFKRAQAALRPPTPLIDLSSANDGEDAMDTASSSAAKMTESYIFVKENCCPDDAWGKGTEFLDPADSSLTRYVHLDLEYRLWLRRTVVAPYCGRLMV